MAVKERLEERVSRDKLERMAKAAKLLFEGIANGEGPTQAYVARTYSIGTPEFIDFLAETRGIGYPSDKEEALEYLENLQAYARKLELKCFD